ncbi:DEAD/DEAH box helicase [Cereibacter azotoformans]|uniref:ATP-dependent RNA helicase DeaD n=1 Tax=Cereibacter azotoformans TaxID=43057 RepID=A0A2T5JV27_9RHOB|nr:DEAD/DEAH box helicase [Cereibacter azotoformans]AXQ94732.1 DEAD/DEAH box helicase [Cereibacter sphaeroides]MBO4170411.1 DEAD/DEAH box helicase [Cereibacter azotoformans]PTR14030.1 ATP-dependent RNA helicase DeaD [Cereibacter azotoformans]UIJ30300.1 DEAD/DEAH box helicase [Cereibacter azotoformans]
MTHTDIAAPLAAALAAKGYESLTPVQEAVLAEGVAGRDALVSAQTGSGKTVAFGIAVADQILQGADRLLFADTPIALAIAPTRELALQVARELGWLYAEAGAQIATCVGGMDYRTERRALERGAHIVVGTPGRLRDHIERGSLDLTGLRAVVLDEADEMLDLGFREDLEFILGSAPEERRTLMFSATVPKEIEALAKEFQQDAVRIQTAGERKQHADIEYRVLTVSARDREHAIFNVLRFYEAPSAIVFCKTRMAVNHLLARMGNRGFQVVALSGELSQQERTHALQALRDGRARVCIATDVAARGIDLPGLELVIHADLPTNSETLLHRSGRTGRAGAKGVSVLIAAPSEVRKAQRLLSGAKLVADWGKPPSADEVQERDDARLLEHPVLGQDLSEEMPLAEKLLERFGPAQMASAFVRLWREARSAPEVLQDVAPPEPAQRAPRERGEFGEAVWYSVGVGHTGRAEARWLLPKICEAGGVTKNEIGAIRVQQEQTFVQIAKAAAKKFGDALEIEAGVGMVRLEGEPSLERPERAPRKPFAERTARTRDEAPRREKAPYQPKPSRFVEEERDEAPRSGWTPDDRPARPRREDSGHVAKREMQEGTGARREGSDEGRKPRQPQGERPARPAYKGAATRAEGTGRSAGYKSHGGTAGRSTGYKSHGAAGDDAPRGKPRGEGAPRAAGFKSHDKPARDETGPRERGPDARPARPSGYKGARDDRPAKPRAEGGAKKDFAKKDAPRKPRADASDTSRRFTPPKKPRG